MLTHEGHHVLLISQLFAFLLGVLGIGCALTIIAAIGAACRGARSRQPTPPRDPMSPLVVRLIGAALLLTLVTLSIMLALSFRAGAA